ncbi:MAG: efflux RND transporter periplasmic adaptor subunit [Kiritimatiellae bacterium]|nr:efflux RND transporter periplasmic adaptor subunit [Kiritimatiellia bacterium]
MSFLSLLLAAEIVLPIAEVTERPDFQTSRYPGKVVPIAKVDVVPQVSGEILEVAFANGQTVSKGDVLYRLDSVKYEAAVRNAESKLAECKANVQYAELSYERHKKLLESRAVSLDAVDNALSQRDSSRAAYAAAQAELVAAKDDLKHCTITAPIAGKIGSTAKTEGNYVTAGSLTLVTIVQFDPVRVKFSVSNREMLDLLAGEGGDLRGQDDIGVTVQLANGTQFGPVGAIEYIENLADDATDTVTAYARFDNPERRLVPGGTVSVTVSSKSGVLRTAIPPTAVLQDTQSPYVWVVGADGKAERRTIARGDLVGDWLFVEKGLRKGDRIVADGAHRVSRGMTVKAAPASKR